MSDQFMKVFLDLLPNSPKNDQTRENFRGILREEFERNLPDAVDRLWELPPVMLQNPEGDYVALLSETRDLFIAGHFYSCVAMCGIVGERLIKDMFRASVFIQIGGNAARPTGAAFDQLERVEVGGIIRFLREAELLSVEAAKAAENLGKLRNQYAHARGKDQNADAISAIRVLHTLIEGTVSVFKDFEMTDRGLVQKATPSADLRGA